MPLLDKLMQQMQSFCIPSIDKADKEEFGISVAKTNVDRVKIISITFIFLEIVLLITYVCSSRNNHWRDNQVYAFMYLAMLLMMVAFSFIFRKLGTNISGNVQKILLVGSLFSIFVLAWSAGISLLDQQVNGQVIVYVVALISIAVVPIFQPLLLLLMYLLVHVLFLIYMPEFQPSNALVFANSINSTAFLVISWTISCTRYKKQEELFKNQKLLKTNSLELSRINKELEEANRKLEILSQIDGLTGIFNRMMFENKIKGEWNRCKRHSIPLSMMMIDIDFFKPFNDHYGHRAGDGCVQQIATALVSEAKRSADFVARYGGEEFAVVLPHTEKVGALILAEQMRQKVEDLGIIHGFSSVSSVLTVSIGVYTVIPTEESDLEDYIDNADKALYRAKLTRNTVSE
jgi:diguanylate cyclase (GGDEF)-like protein